MITVTFRPTSFRASQFPEKPEYMIVNWRVSARPHVWRPPTDLYEIEDVYKVRVEIAGMQENDFEITLDQNLLIVRGVRPDLSEPRSYHQMEINYGEFLTAIELPAPINAESVTADYKNGFLWIILPKAKPRHIFIQE